MPQRYVENENNQGTDSAGLLVGLHYLVEAQSLEEYLAHNECYISVSCHYYLLCVYIYI